MPDLCACGSRTRRPFIAVVFTDDGVQHPAFRVSAYCADHANDEAEASFWQRDYPAAVEAVEVVDIDDLASLGLVEVATLH